MNSGFSLYTCQHCHPPTIAVDSDSLISQIKPLLILQLPIRRLRPKGRLPLILPLVVPPYEEEIHKARRPAADDGDLGGDVARGVLGPEGLRADDVADAVADEVEGGDGRLLGVASHVAGNEREEGDEAGRARLGEVVACEAAAVIGEGQGDDEDHAEGGEHEAGGAE